MNKMTKNIISTFLCLVAIKLFAQNPAPGFDGKNWLAPYSLSIPEGWAIERFLIPISFAPQITFNGIEDIRFTPGWGDVKSEQYWSYAFLWYLNDSPLIDARIIENILKFYYSGLISSNSEKYKIPATKIFPPKTKFHETKTVKGDQKTFAGTIDMLDYMQQRPIKLNCIVHLKSCSELNRTIVFYEISPKVLTENAWQSLNQLWTDFDCDPKTK
jgi:hypothetical protein